jgi:predicted ATPase
MTLLAIAKWVLGEIGQTRGLIEEAIESADETGHAPTQTLVRLHKAVFDVIVGDAKAVLGTSQDAVELCHKHGIADYPAIGSCLSGWATVQLGNQAMGLEELRRGLAEYLVKGDKLLSPMLHGLLADIDAEREGIDGILVGFDRTFVIANETGEHWADAFLHRVRGDITRETGPQGAG